jgi:bifunctional enzyme CysN/CysC
MAGGDLLRFITCGSVDDGKSTLIGRLLYDCGAVPEDQRRQLEADTRKLGGEGLDFSLLVDGLSAEREQGITIDVAYRYFSTPQRSFIVADTPGHEQYTRNMITGASTADLALILVDARKGVLTQTRRHSTLVALVGVKHAVLVVTKMDLVGYDAAVFGAIVEAYRPFAARAGLANVVAIPTSGREGDNVAAASTAMPWYRGFTLLQHLESVAIEDERASLPLRMAVQGVTRAGEFRGFTGRLASGVARPGDAVRVLPTGHAAQIARIVTADGDLPAAHAGQSVTLSFDRDLDCSRGDVIAAADAPCETADQFQATLAWMGEAPLLPGRAYWLKIGAKTLGCAVTDIKHKIDVDTLEPSPAKQLALNEIATINLSVDQPIPFDAYDDNKETGGFILIDRITNATVGAGLLRFPLRRAHNIHWQAIDISREARARAMMQRPAVLWFTGLSGAGKSTIANLVEKKLHAMGRHTLLLDGDNLRHGLNRDLGFTQANRVENVRRVAEVARLMSDAGLIVLVALISPFREERAMARALAAPGEFFEIFVDAPLALAEQRDPKGLYKKARAGQLKNFTGVDSPYEPPEAAEIHIDAARMDSVDAAELIVARILAAIRPADA